jgi:hypothetical protein
MRSTMMEMIIAWRVRSTVVTALTGRDSALHVILLSFSTMRAATAQTVNSNLTTVNVSLAPRTARSVQTTPVNARNASIQLSNSMTPVSDVFVVRNNFY